MRHLRRVVTRVLAMLGWSRRGGDFADELESHLQLHIDDNIRAGMPPDEARRVALARIGSVAAVSARQRDQRVLPGVESLFQDLRHGARLLRVSPVFSAVAMLSLALGIGANTAIFSIVNGAMLRALPVADPSRLVQLSGKDDTTDFSNRLWEEIKARPSILHEAFAWGEASFDLADRGEAQQVDGLYVSGSFFAALGVAPAAGRLLTAADDVRDGAGPHGAVAVVSHRFWQQRLGGGADAIGRTIRLNRVPFIVVGVMPPSFFGPVVGRQFDIAAPIGSISRVRGESLPLDEPAWRWLMIMGRLAPGQTLAQAQAAIEGSTSAIREATTSAVWDTKDRDDYLAEPLRLEAAPGGPDDFRSRYARPLVVLMGIVALVLLIACANIANLLLARVAGRQRELSLRLSLGASRLRLARQLLTESLLLATFGGLGALAIARWGSAVLITQLSTGATPIHLDAPLDWRVLGFTAIVAVGVSLLFGVVPALRASRVAPAGAAGARLVASEARARWGSALIVVQVALSLVLVVGAGMFVQTLARLNARDPGFDRRSVLVVSLDGRRTAVPAEARLAMYERVRAAIAALPGVADAALSRMTPVSGYTWGTSVENTPGLDLPESQRDVRVNFVTPGWFRVYGMRMRAGRDLTEADVLDARPVAIVNETFARRFFPGRSPVGESFRQVVGPNESVPAREIVGVVGDAIYESVRESFAPTVYFPVAPTALQQTILLSVRTAAGEPGSLAPSITAAALGVQPDLTLSAFRSLDAQLAASIARERLLALLGSIFGALGLLVAALGVFGVLSYGVTRRLPEFGVRLALGARPSSIVALVLKRAVLLTGVGVAAGLTLSVGLARLTASLLFEADVTTSRTMALSVMLLVAIALASSWWPARRAATTDPTQVLRR